MEGHQAASSPFETKETAGGSEEKSVPSEGGKPPAVFKRKMPSLFERLTGMRRQSSVFEEELITTSPKKFPEGGATSPKSSDELEIPTFLRRK
jgi:hypothetical protein